MPCTHPDPIGRGDDALAPRRVAADRKAAFAWAHDLQLPFDHFTVLKALLRCARGRPLVRCVHLDTIIRNIEGRFASDDRPGRIIRILLAWGVIFEVPPPKGRRCRAYGFAVGAATAIPERPRRGRSGQPKECGA